MATTRKITDKDCKSCGKKLIDTHMKNPFIDDFEITCENESCSQFQDGLGILTWRAKCEAKAEYERDM